MTQEEKNNTLLHLQCKHGEFARKLVKALYIVKCSQETIEKIKAKNLPWVHFFQKHSENLLQLYKEDDFDFKGEVEGELDGELDLEIDGEAKKEIKSSKKEIEDDGEHNQLNHDIKERLEWWRLVVLIIMAYFSCLIFTRYLPLEFVTDKDLWNNFTDKCCTFTNCTISNSCKKYLTNWMTIKNLNNTVLDRCCYWYAPYSNWKFYAKPFCTLSCLSSF